MNAILNRIGYYAQMVFMSIFQASIDAWDLVRDRVLFAIFVNLMAFAGVFLCVRFGNKELAIVLCIFSSILIFVTWVLCSAIARVAQEKSVSVAGEVRKLISPLLTASLMMSFVAYYIAMQKDFSAVFSMGFLIVLLIAFFFLLFFIYIGRETKATGYIMAGIVIFMTFQTYAPEEYQYLTFVSQSLEKYTKKISTEKLTTMNVDSSARYATVIESGRLYKDGVAGNDLLANTMVMVINKAQDEKSENEPMATIKLANPYGDFVGNEVFQFPHRKLGKLSKTSDFNQAKTAATRTVVWKQNISPTPEKIRTGLSVKDGGSFMITADKSFYLVEGNGQGGSAQLIKINGPVTNREHYYKFGGGISVKAIEPNTNLSIRIL